MNEVSKTVEWTLPVVDSDSKSKSLLPDKSVKLSNAAWTSVAIGVVTKKILRNDASAEYPFPNEKE